LLQLLTAAYGTNAKSSDVRATAAFGGKSGRDMLSMSSSHFDPQRKLSRPSDSRALGIWAHIRAAITLATQGRLEFPEVVSFDTLMRHAHALIVVGSTTPQILERQRN
jgi:hypothetical protein